MNAKQMLRDLLSAQRACEQLDSNLVCAIRMRTESLHALWVLFLFCFVLFSSYICPFFFLSSISIIHHILTHSLFSPHLLSPFSIHDGTQFYMKGLARSEMWPSVEPIPDELEDRGVGCELASGGSGGEEEESSRNRATQQCATSEKELKSSLQLDEKDATALFDFNLLEVILKDVLASALL